MVKISKRKNVTIREKRSTSIAPTRIDKELLVDVGKILEQVCKEECDVSINLYADSKEVETEDFKVFDSMPIPQDIYAIMMGIFSNEDYNPVEIEIDCKKPKDSKIRVVGEDATWVQGVSERLAKAFEKKKLGYRPIAKYELIRLAMSMIAAGFLSYATGFAVCYFKLFEPFYVMVYVLTFFYAMSMLIRKFFDWVFPYFEIGSEGFRPRKFRKLMLAILWGSGIIPTILFKVLGLS